MKRKNSALYRSRYVLISFFACAGVMLLMFMILGYTPFGKYTVLRMDLYHQYGPLFAELYERVRSSASFSYSWISGLGSCFLGNYFNYLSSPIGAIVLFFGHKNVPQAIAAMVLIKAALSSASMTYYLKKSQKNQSPLTVMFGILYAFCGYMLAYYWNVMWLDAMALFPLMLLGIERIIENRRFYIYVAALCLSMLSNYYMSFMLCLFAVVYFFYYYFAFCAGKRAIISSEYAKAHPSSLIHRIKNSRFLKSGITFALASLLSAGLMAVVLVPTYYVLQSSSATGNSFPSELKTYFNAFDFLINHFASIQTTIRSSGEDVLPNVYCGVLTIILVPLYFFTRSIKLREKLATVMLLGFFYINFNTNFLNFIWHGFHFPNDLPYRYSFMYSFFLVLIAYKTLVRLNELTAKQIGAVGGVIVLLAFLTDKIESKNFEPGTFYITIIFAVIYVAILSLFKGKKYEIASLAVLLCVCVCSEAIIADTPRISASVDYQSYTSDYDKFTEIKQLLDEKEDGEFYRMELSSLRTRMDPSWYYYNGVSVFSSMAYESTSLLEDHLGLMSNRINSYTYNPQTPVYNMMHALKYVVNNTTPCVLDSKYYTKLETVDKYTAYENNYYLPIAFAVSGDIENWDYVEDKSVIVNPFEVQGDFFSRAAGVSDPFEKVSISFISYSNVEPFTSDIDAGVYSYKKTVADTDASATFSVTTQKAGNLYMYYHVDGASEKSITVNSSKGTTTHSADRDMLIDLGSFEENETLSINVPFEQDSGNMRLFTYTINDEVLDEGYEKLKQGAMTVTGFSDTKITGSVSVQDDCILYTSIPYDEAWEVTVDGKAASEDDIVKIGNAFVGVRLGKGEHTIELNYVPRGVSFGICVSLISLAVLAAYVLMDVLRKKRAAKRARLRPAYPAVEGHYSEHIIYPSPRAKKSENIASPKETPKNGEVTLEVFYPTKQDSRLSAQIFYPNGTEMTETDES